MSHRGPYVQTLTGRHWYFTDPRPEDVCFDDLRALSRLTRYGGHTDSNTEFYCVLDHSVRVADVLASWGASPRVQLAGLLHDGGESYPPGDLLGPVVRWLEKIQAETGVRNPVLEMRDRAQDCVVERFGVADVFTEPESAALILRADRVLLATERRDLVAPSDVYWGSLPEPLPTRIEPWSPARASAEFQRRFNALSGGRR